MQLLPTLLEAVKTTNFQNALTATLGQVCELGKWDYGEAWIPSNGGTILQHSSAFYINTHQSKDCISRGAILAL